MGTGIFNIIVGVLSILAGLSGRFAFIGTDSPWPLIALGVVIAGLGVYQIMKARR